MGHYPDSRYTFPSLPVPAQSEDPRPCGLDVQTAQINTWVCHCSVCTALCSSSHVSLWTQSYPHSQAEGRGLGMRLTWMIICIIIYWIYGHGFQEAGWKVFPVLVGSSLWSVSDWNEGADAWSTAVKMNCTNEEPMSDNISLPIAVLVQ